MRGWSAKDRLEIVGQARAGDEPSTMGGEKSGPAIVEGAFGAAAEPTCNRPVMSQAEADQMAKARIQRGGPRLRLAARASATGAQTCARGKVVKIEGIGQRFSGHYYVTSVRHRYTPQRGY